MCSSINHVNYVIANNLPALTHTHEHRQTLASTHMHMCMWAWCFGGSVPVPVLGPICNASLICLLSTSCGSAIFAVALNQQSAPERVGPAQRAFTVTMVVPQLERRRFQTLDKFG